MRAFKILGVVALLVSQAHAEEKDARGWIEEMVQTVGSMEKLHALRDVEYRYTYRTPEGAEDVSTERYVFDGELSWAEYRTMRQMPEGVSSVVQGYDGRSTWVTHDGRPVDDPQALRRADFLRKTNFYWLVMMQKLLDPGIGYEDLGPQDVDGVMYDRVKVTFGEDVGDAQDTYVLYLHPKTRLVDRFLFTVMDFGKQEPHLMTVQYEEIDGVMLPTKRAYVDSNWNGEILGEEWVEETCEDVRFNNGFERSMFLGG
ncbi:MAG: hypothetical protein DHS20C21_09820 [Gemmatimonadota bacterium]|nr:MAG: hypothetical protein DHS20C21_09820 [Gemmatimonadota bacterium]